MQGFIDDLVDTVNVYRQQAGQRNEQLERLARANQELAAESEKRGKHIEELTARVDELVLQVESLKPNPATAPKANGADPDKGRALKAVEAPAAS